MTAEIKKSLKSSGLETLSGPSLLQAFIGKKVVIRFDTSKSAYSSASGKLVAADANNVLLEDPVEVFPGLRGDGYWSQGTPDQSIPNKGMHLYPITGPAFRDLAIQG